MRAHLTAAAATFAVVLCAGAGAEDGELVDSTSLPLTGVCDVTLGGKVLPVETDYVPRVVMCENGAASLEALKAQAVAARTYLYFKLETSGSITDGQGDQVYGCGKAPTPNVVEAVKATSGQVLRYKNTTLASFFVAGGKASPPACRGDTAAATEKYVTYNEGLSGTAVRQSTIGFVSPTNYRNRGCMSQNGADCLSDAGRKYDDILRFYYGADVGIEAATGPCITPPGKPDGGVADATEGAPPTAADASAGAPTAPPAGGQGARMVSEEASGCRTAAGSTSSAPGSALALALALIARAATLRRARQRRALTLGPGGSRASPSPRP